MHKEQELFLLHITAQYVAEVQAGRQPRLSDYLAHYPCYADAIADFVAYYHAVEEVMPSTEILPHSTGAMPSAETLSHPTDAIPEEYTVNRVPTSRITVCPSSINYSSLCDKRTFDELPLAGAQQDEQPERLASAGTMTTLLATATGQQLTLSQVAAELDLSIDIILLLEQRAMAPATIPHVLYEQIAMLLQQPEAMVREYLCSLGQHQPRSAVQKKERQMKVAEESAAYPVPHVVDKPSFRAIVETSLQLSALQRSRWCTILDAEGP